MFNHRIALQHNARHCSVTHQSIRLSILCWSSACSSTSSCLWCVIRSTCNLLFVHSPILPSILLGIQPFYSTLRPAFDFVALYLLAALLLLLLYDCELWFSVLALLSVVLCPVIVYCYLSQCSANWAGHQILLFLCFPFCFVRLRYCFLSLLSLFLHCDSPVLVLLNNAIVSFTMGVPVCSA